MKKAEASVLLALAALGLLIGAFFSHVGLGLAIALLLFSLWSLLRVRKVVRWLEKERAATVTSDPPEMMGELGELLDYLYHSRRRFKDDFSALERRVLHFQSSFASLDDATVLLNSSEDIDWCNSAAHKLLGLRFPEDQRQRITNLIRAPEFIRYFDAGDYASPLALVSPIADDIELEFHISYFGSGNRILFVRNITEMRRLERTRTDFIANASHELRTPLTVIKGYIEAMQDPDSEWSAALLQMQDHAGRMESLLTDLTELTRLESMSENAERQDEDEVIAIAEMVGILLDEVGVQRPGQKLEQRIKTDVQLIGKPREIYSALSNLINNASKYSAEDGHIVVKWEREGVGACLTVKDNGVGIAPQHIDRLTERFYRADVSRNSQTGGTGLGLAIVKHILLRHQSQLTIRSTVAKGSQFKCHFPPERVVAADVPESAPDDMVP